MKNIAIFVSGEGASAERIVKLFNEGNRLNTELVIADNTSAELVEKLKGENVTIIQIPEEDWLSRTEEIASLLKEKEIRLLVLDNFNQVIPDEIMEAVEGEMIRVTSPEQAPREVVNALEADLRRGVEEEKPVATEENQDPTPESEWADALKIQFTPPKIPTTPPEVPNNDINRNEQENRNNFRRDYHNKRQGSQDNYQQERINEGAPMPSTYLIWSILATVFCCFIPGIIAIIFSSMVSSKYYIGDLEGSRRASRMAEIWIIVSVVLGVVAATLYIPFMLLGN